ncbi:MAG: TIGR01777 family oxidoreductase [Gemmataceae bacterium]
MRVFITGGTGLIGHRLIRQLVKRGDQVTVLSRRADAWERVGNDVMIVTGDPTQPGDWQSKLAECDAVVNLVGAGIFDQRWSNEYKAIIRDSRVKSTQNVVAALLASCKVLVSGSAIGFYGPHGDEELTEESPAGNAFMAQICQEWEQAARAAETKGVRVVLLRTGIVQDAEGGALAQLLLPFKLGAGGPVGMGLNPAKWGRQYWSWIHHADEVGLALLALDHPDARGAINATAPNPVTSKQYAKALGCVLGRPAFAPLPGLALRLMLGEVAQVITTGQRVLPAKALALGYRFQFPDLDAALRDILR